MNPQTSVNPSFTGIVGGGFVGYNYQINQFVIGVQGDIQGAGLQGNGYNVLTDLNTDVTQNWFGAVNGRLGFVYDRALIYAIGGASPTRRRPHGQRGSLYHCPADGFGHPGVSRESFVEQERV